MNIINTIELDSRPQYYSVSRLKSFHSCSYYYYHQYVAKTKATPPSESTLIGNLLHNALEYLYTVDDVEVFYLIDAFNKTASDGLKKYCGIPGNERELDELVAALATYVKDIQQLYDRAAPNYTGPNPVRKKDGKPADNPQMTTDWKNAEKELNLDKRKSLLDLIGKERSEKLETLSLCDIFREAYNIASRYRTPAAIQEVVAVEFPLSHWNEDNKTLANPVLMPEGAGGEEGLFLNSYIDFVAKVNYRGELKLALIDHKSSKSDFAEDMVKYNRQLYAYVYGYETLTGQTVEVIGINNLRTNTLALAEVDRDIMKESLNSLFSVHTLITKNHFIKHMPEDKYSKCLSNYGGVCPFLEFCHKELYDKLS